MLLLYGKNTEITCRRHGSSIRKSRLLCRQAALVSNQAALHSRVSIAAITARTNHITPDQVWWKVLKPLTWATISQITLVNVNVTYINSTFVKSLTVKQWINFKIQLITSTTKVMEWTESTWLKLLLVKIITTTIYYIYAAHEHVYTVNTILYYSAWIKYSTYLFKKNVILNFTPKL